jgi:hypothetical protein
VARLHPQSEKAEEKGLGSPQSLLAEICLIRLRNPGLTHFIPEGLGRPIADKG